MPERDDISDLEQRLQYALCGDQFKFKTFLILDDPVGAQIK